MSGDDRSLWQKLLTQVLNYFTAALEATHINVKGSVIKLLTLEQSEEVVQSFSEEEFKQWEARVQNCAESSDWTSLLDPRTTWLPCIPFSTRTLTICYTVISQVQPSPPPASPPCRSGLLDPDTQRK
jgi:hypothetical protein